MRTGKYRSNVRQQVKDSALGELFANSQLLVYARWCIVYAFILFATHCESQTNTLVKQKIIQLYFAGIWHESNPFLLFALAKLVTFAVTLFLSHSGNHSKFLDLIINTAICEMLFLV